MVIAVILILAGITFGISRGVQNSQARAKAKAELAIIAQGLEQFKATYGDYPWIGDTSGTANANDLLLALTGWKKMERSGNTTRLSSTLSTPGKSFIDPTKLSLSASFPADDVPPATLVIQDPWGSNYIYVYRTSSTGWDNFGYLLFSEGPDAASETPPPDGVLEQDDRGGSNIDNIYAGE